MNTTISKMPSLLRGYKELLEKKERELKMLKEKIAKGEVSGNGAPQMVKDIVKEINALKIKLGYPEL